MLGRAFRAVSIRRNGVLRLNISHRLQNRLPLIGHLASSTSFSSSSTPPPIPPNRTDRLSWKETFSLLQLKDYSKEEIEKKLQVMSQKNLKPSSFDNDNDNDSDVDAPNTQSTLTVDSISNYIRTDLSTYSVGMAHETPEMISRRLLSRLSSPSVSGSASEIHDMSGKVDIKALMPLTTSMLLVGSCVGMITPIMPYIVEDLSLSTAQFGYVISAFGFAKLLGNIPSAILVERHGRKPYLVYSLLAVGAGTAGIGFAGALDQLLACRLAVGLGVAALSTSATLTITDISTPNNRASTMAPVMAAFAAGTALGPAVGGILADSIGVQNTFSMIGVAFLGNAVLNGTFLTETKVRMVNEQTGGERRRH